LFQKFASTTNISFCEDFKFRQKFKTKAEPELTRSMLPKDGSTTVLPSFFRRLNRATKGAHE